MNGRAIPVLLLLWALPALAQYEELEVGVKLFLPVSPFEEPHFRYREKGGGISRNGRDFGGDILRRMVFAYLQGSF